MSEDIRLKCVDCGEEFIFSVGEQQFYRDRGLENAPTRCKRCRDARKANRKPGGGGGGGHGAESGGRGGQMFTATCSECGDTTQVPFKPSSGRPIYCKDCFAARRGGGAPKAAATAERDAGMAISEPRGGRPQGTVKWFDEGKGYGFIQEDTGEDVFVHFSAIHGQGFRTLIPGNRVEFDIVMGAKGKQAADVIRIG